MLAAELLASSSAGAQLASKLDLHTELLLLIWACCEAGSEASGLAVTRRQALAAALSLAGFPLAVALQPSAALAGPTFTHPAAAAAAPSAASNPVAAVAAASRGPRTPSPEVTAAVNAALGKVIGKVGAAADAKLHS